MIVHGLALVEGRVEAEVSPGFEVVATMLEELTATQSGEALALAEAGLAQGEMGRVELASTALSIEGGRGRISLRERERVGVWLSGEELVEILESHGAMMRALERSTARS